MYGKMNKISGLARVRISGEMPQSFLNCCTRQGLELHNVRLIEPMVLELAVRSSELKAVRSAAVKSCCEVAQVRFLGKSRWAKALKLRFLPAAMALIFVSLLFLSKFYVWEISVTGNSSVAAGRILDVLADCGVKSGAFWPDFSADNIRSEVLCQIPELSWMTVNMRGSLAEVVVVEREEPPEMIFEGASADIVAERSGFVTKIDALVGQSAVKAGSAVNEGDVLISGVTESSFAPPRFLRAHGSVTAEVNSILTAVKPQNESVREYTGAVKRKYALIVGNNRINFYSDSSISDGFCDKIISVWKAEADGLFSFPLSLVCIKEVFYEAENTVADGHEGAGELERALRTEFDRELKEAEILSEKLSYAESEGLYVGSLHTRCLCEIGSLLPLSQARMAEAEAKFTEKADEE